MQMCQDHLVWEKLGEKKTPKYVMQEEQGAVISPNFIPLLCTEHSYIIYNASYSLLEIILNKYGWNCLKLI